MTETQSIRLVLTKAVSDRAADDEPFSEFVAESMTRFLDHDWGSLDEHDWKLADEAVELIDNGGWYGSLLASYSHPAQYWTIWITRNIADQDGTQAITVLFPDEY